MENRISKEVAFTTLVISLVILGIILPKMFFTQHVLIFQIICSLLFISPVMYSKYKADKENRVLMDKILYISRHDDLTDAYNRRHFNELLNQSIGDKTASERCYILVFFDIDNLKDVNDNLGHDVGDQVILTFAKTIKDNIRKTDLLTRYGGDEFIVVFFDVEYALLKEKIKTIQEQLQENPICYNGEKVFVEFSYGIARCPDDADEFVELKKIADRRMYLSKQDIKKKRIKEDVIL